MIWYVSPLGNDAQDGRNPGTAFKSLGRAVEAAKPGDTILIAPGAYGRSAGASERRAPPISPSR
jgi:hypothetical protein